MILDPAIAISDDLFAFRCVVTIGLYEPRIIGDMEAAFIVRTYGVSAVSYSEAVAAVEAAAGRELDAHGQPEGQVPGWIDELEIVVMDPEDIREEAASKASIKRRGIHFVSPAILFDDEGEEVEDLDQDG